MDLDNIKKIKTRHSENTITGKINLTENQILRQNKCWPTFLTIVSYLISEQKKKQRAFQIGVFTVFLVVSFLTLLKSAVDVAPVAFVKLGQD